MENGINNTKGICFNIVHASDGAILISNFNEVIQSISIEVMCVTI